MHEHKTSTPTVLCVCVQTPRQMHEHNSTPTALCVPKHPLTSVTPDTKHTALCPMRHYLSPTYTALRVYKHPLTIVRCMTPTHSTLSCVSLSLQHPHHCGCSSIHWQVWDTWHRHTALCLVCRYLSNTHNTECLSIHVQTSMKSVPPTHAALVHSVHWFILSSVSLGDFSMCWWKNLHTPPQNGSWKTEIQQKWKAVLSQNVLSQSRLNVIWLINRLHHQLQRKIEILFLKRTSDSDMSKLIKHVLA